MKRACDLCGVQADFHLCQEHLDLFRIPDVFSTGDGDYPEKGVMVIWDDGDETHIGWYDHGAKLWVDSNDDCFRHETTLPPVYWYPMFSLHDAYKFLTESWPEVE